jgi:hypothetical protein
LWSTGQVRASGFLATVEQVRLGTATLPVAVLALLATTSCSSSDAGPKSLPSLSATASRAAPAPIPPQATPNTSLALDAFVRFYFQQLNVAFSTSDGSLVRRYSDPECGTCQNYAKALDTNPDHVIRGDSFSIIDVAALPVARDGTLVEVFFNVPARELVDANGRVLEALPAAPNRHFTLNVLRTATGWSVRGIRLGD